MKPILIGLMSAVLLTAAVPGIAHQNQASDDQHRMQNSRMMQMREQMDKTEKIMEEIHGNKQPAKRQEMMMQHMHHMRMGMDMMDMHGDEKAGYAKQDQPCPYMDDRMEMMEEQMDMMHKMMRQMMEHQSVQDMPMHK
ncbi:hypothetical protein [Neptuniibacter sp. CAU 1671]|uniref:hypothetical protein n=1 Tax=Neptuniibacter sp. CAU 1671 TaxID=3032593 RepID=UPI0023DCB0DE|nr:hypothetical protein [Neptuniibacter sp. CAU 1671]MDF2180989.1 hypothetical protein [Neptuniibacter sp. CAU 1671]